MNAEQMIIYEKYQRITEKIKLLKEQFKQSNEHIDSPNADEFRHSIGMLEIEAGEIFSKLHRCQSR